MEKYRPPWQTAEEVRRINRELDDKIASLVEQVAEDNLTDGPPGEWTLAENLGHLGEFPQFFARQLRAWLSKEQKVVGRVAEYDAQRNDAVLQSRDRSVVDLQNRVVRALEELDTALEAVRDEHLRSKMVNVKYGEEPFMSFLDRYVIGHKAAHLQQLEFALQAGASRVNEEQAGWDRGSAE